jgi:hypothetical protein
MANASRDENDVPTVLGALNTDGVTPIPIKIDDTTHGLKINDGTTGSDFGLSVAQRDENHVTILLAASSSDGVTPVEVYADSSGNILINSM